MLLQRLRSASRRTGAALVRVAAALASPIGFRELMLFAGAGLIGFGAAQIYPPAGWALPGLILAGVAIFGVRS